MKARISASNAAVSAAKASSAASPAAQVPANASGKTRAGCSGSSSRSNASLDGLEEQLLQRRVDAGHAAPVEEGGQAGVVAVRRVVHLAEVEEDLVLVGVQVHEQPLPVDVAAGADELEPGDVVAEDREVAVGIGQPNPSPRDLRTSRRSAPPPPSR